MTSVFSPLAALTVDPNSGPFFEDGDVAVIMKADGSVKAFSAGLDGSRLATVPEEEWTESDHLAASQGRKLLAVSLAVGNPQILDIMYAMLDDPSVTETLQKLAQRH